MSRQRRRRRGRRVRRRHVHWYRYGAIGCGDPVAGWFQRSHRLGGRGRRETSLGWQRRGRLQEDCTAAHGLRQLRWERRETHGLLGRYADPPLPCLSIRKHPRAPGPRQVPLLHVHSEGQPEHIPPAPCRPGASSRHGGYTAASCNKPSSAEHSNPRTVQLLRCRNASNYKPLHFDGAKGLKRSGKKRMQNIKQRLPKPRSPTTVRLSIFAQRLKGHGTPAAVGFF